MAKIMVVHHSGIIGGAGVSLINNLKQISAHHEVVVYLPSDPQDMIQMVREECPKVRIEVYGRRIGAITYYSGGDSILSLRFWYRAALILVQHSYWNRCIQAENPDVLLVNSSILGWMGSLRSARSRNSVCYIRETKKGSARSIPNRLLHHFYERFTKVIFISEYDRQQENLQQADSTVIYNYIDTQKMDRSIDRVSAEERLGLEHNGCFRALYVGGVSYMKGLDLAWDAVEHCKMPVELIVAGQTVDEAMCSKSGTARKYARQIKKRLEENSRVRIVGKQSNMSFCYAACDALVFPMRSPHQARPVFEAGYFGKPVLITDFPNVSEFVRDGFNGFLIAPESAEMLGEKLDDLAEDPSLCHSMGQSNYELCIKKHLPEISGSKLIQLIEGLSLNK